MVQGDHYSFVCFPKLNSVLKTTQVSKAAGLDNLSGCFLKVLAKFLSKPISDLSNFSVTFEKFDNFCKVTKLKSLYKNVFLTLACNCRPISSFLLILKVIEMVIHVIQVLS